VFLNGVTGVEPGDIVRARVTNADDYDVWAELDKLPSSNAFQVE
jgi:ribosomal protein S12 methylthiotransferase